MQALDTYRCATQVPHTGAPHRWPEPVKMACFRCSTRASHTGVSHSSKITGEAGCDTVTPTSSDMHTFQQKQQSSQEATPQQP